MKRFRMIDESFTCKNCQMEVNALGYTARNHCPYCLYSIHIDNNPGDRAADCFGLLKPIAIEKAKKDTYKIVFRCNKCKTIKKNKTAKDDNQEKILQIMQISDLY